MVIKDIFMDESSLQIRARGGSQTCLGLTRRSWLSSSLNVRLSLSWRVCSRDPMAQVLCLFPRFFFPNTHCMKNHSAVWLQDITLHNSSSGSLMLLNKLTKILRKINERQKIIKDFILWFPLTFPSKSSYSPVWPKYHIDPFSLLGIKICISLRSGPLFLYISRTLLFSS